MNPSDMTSGVHCAVTATGRMSISIECVSELSQAELAPLVDESEQAGWRFLRRLVDEWSSGQNRFDRSGEVLLVARDAGCAVGVCGLNVDPYADSQFIGRVRHLYVAADCRRHGIGRQLVQRVILPVRDTFRELRLRTDSSEAARFLRGIAVPSRRCRGGVHARTDPERLGLNGRRARIGRPA